MTVEKHTIYEGKTAQDKGIMGKITQPEEALLEKVGFSWSQAVANAETLSTAGREGTTTKIEVKRSRGCAPGTRTLQMKKRTHKLLTITITAWQKNECNRQKLKQRRQKVKKQMSSRNSAAE